MSEQPSSTSSVAWFFRPRWFLIGLVVGLGMMAWLGRRAAASDYHPNFTRFFPPISPEASYYPTVDEMCAIVRARCRPDQVLVIVGGNSVLLGVWQPAPVMWTRKLQEILGDRYCVINFALRGATPTDGGAVIAEVLRDEFPRQIYIANEKALTGIFPMGNETYRPLFWQAYFGGRLLSYEHRNARVQEYVVHRDHWALVPEIVGGALLDRGLRFNDFWNRVAFEHLNTVALHYAPAPPAMFSPRKIYGDQEPDGTSTTLEERYMLSAREAEMRILRGTTERFYERAEDNGWRLKAGTKWNLDRYFGEAFPVQLRPRTLLLIGRDSVFYRRQLPSDELARDEQAIHETVALLRANGYVASDYGADFTETDYGDRTHLSPMGGEKLANQVAQEITRMVEKLGYLK